MIGQIKEYFNQVGWSDVIAGAIVGILVTSLLSPAVGSTITRGYEAVGVYDSPSLTVEINNQSEYHPPGASVEDFGGLVWDEDYHVYQIKIGNPDSTPVDRLKLTWSAPGCIVYTNTKGPTAYGSYWLHNRYDIGVSSQSNLSIDKYQCTKVIEITDGSLVEDEFIAVEFVVTRSFDTCDVLVDSDNTNHHELMYKWSVEGEQFTERRELSPNSLDDDYQRASAVEFIGTRERLETKSGLRVQHFVVGKRGENLTHAIRKCGTK